MSVIIESFTIYERLQINNNISISIDLLLLHWYVFFPVSLVFSISNMSKIVSLRHMTAFWQCK